MSALISFLNLPTWTFIGVLATILIYIVSSFITLKLQKKKLVWGIISIVPIAITNKTGASSSILKKLTISYDGNEVHNVFAYVLRIQNIGSRNIELDDFRSKQLLFKFEEKILEFGKVDYSHSAVKIDLLCIDEKVIKIEAFELDAREWFTFKVITDGQLQNDESILCTEKLKSPHTIKKRNELINKKLQATFQNIEMIFHIILLALSVVLFIAIVILSSLKLIATILFYIFILLAVIYLALILNYGKDYIYRTLTNRADKKSGGQGHI